MKRTPTARRARCIKLLVLALCLVAWAPAQVRAAEITIAAAADLTFVFKDVVSRFEAQTHNTVNVSYGSSGNFFSQIQNGGPFDIFFSADVDYPKKLEAAGLTEPGTIYEYATGKIVLWVPSASKLDLNKGLAVLLDPGINKISIANPAHAPYGRAAVAAMQHEGLYDRLKDKLVLGENVSQAAQFVESGNAEVGVIALSLALAPPMKKKGRYVEVPAADYPPIIQAAVVVKASQNKDAAEQFLKFLKQPATVALMERYGFSVPK